MYLAQGPGKRFLVETFASAPVPKIELLVPGCSCRRGTGDRVGVSGRPAAPAIASDRALAIGSGLRSATVERQDRVCRLTPQQIVAGRMTPSCRAIMTGRQGERGDFFS
jgi:hypothetical protein